MTCLVPMRSAHRARTLLLTLSLTPFAAGCHGADDGAADADASASMPGDKAGAAGLGGGAGAVGESGGSGGRTMVAGAPGGGASGAATAFGGRAGTNGGAGGGTNGGAGGVVGNAGALSSAGGSSSLPHVGPWRITPLGDSITGTTCGPQLLSKALIDHGKTNFTFVGSNLNNQSCNGASPVQSEGHGGYLVTDLAASGQHAAELPKWCESNEADLVLMQFGTNDVWNDRSPSAILAAYSTILSALRAVNANVIVLVAQITPLNPKDCSACESRVVALNSRIPDWATENSTAASPVSVVDLHSAFSAASYTSNSTYTADGVHPNAAGAQLIADKWYAALSALGVP
jgi:lysophospholipase L1-like esterase